MPEVRTEEKENFSFVVILLLKLKKILTISFYMPIFMFLFKINNFLIFLFFL